jgi:hypothetical protein
VAVLDKSDLTINPGFPTSIDMGDVNFYTMEAKNVTTSNRITTITRYKGGCKYNGHVLEIYRDGKLLERKFEGGKVVDDAFNAKEFMDDEVAKAADHPPASSEENTPTTENTISPNF